MGGLALRAGGVKKVGGPVGAVTRDRHILPAMRRRPGSNTCVGQEPQGFATHISQFRMTLPDSPFRITSNAGPYSA